MEAKLWTQMIQHENTSKRNWESMTGDQPAARFYQSQAKDIFNRTYQSISPNRDGYKAKNWEPSYNPIITVSPKVRKSPIPHVPAKVPFALSADPTSFDSGSKDKQDHFRTSFYEAEALQKDKLEQTLGFFKHHLSQ